MNRRGFLKLVTLAAVGTAVDPEQLIWTPGAKTHILPPAGGWRPDWSRIARQYRNGTLDLNHIRDLYEWTVGPPELGIEYWHRELLQERQRVTEDFRVRTRGTMAYRTPDGVVGLNDVLAPLNKHISAVQDALFKAAALLQPKPWVIQRLEPAVYIPPDVS